MADIALSDANAPADLATRAETTRRAGRGDARFHFLTWLAAALVLLIFCGVIASITIGSVPAIKAFGFAFFSPRPGIRPPISSARLPSIYGTLITSVLAMLLAVPVGIGIAIFLTELCPRPLRRPIGIAIELAGRHSFDHLWHLGPVRVRALVAGACAAAGH